MGPAGTGIRRDSGRRGDRIATTHPTVAVLVPPAFGASPGYPHQVCRCRPAPPAPSPPLSSLSSFSNLRAPPRSRSLPCGSAARSPAPGWPRPIPAPPSRPAPPLPLTWQRRHQPCWSSRILCAGRGRGCAVRDCGATAAPARRRARICQAEAATGADLVRGGTVVRIDFGAASARWKQGRSAAGPRAGVSRVVPTLPSGCPGLGSGALELRPGPSGAALSPELVTPSHLPPLLGFCKGLGTRLPHPPPPDHK